MAATPIIEFCAVTKGAIWCIGQHSKAERRELERRARRGELVKVRSWWAGLGPLKMVFISTDN